jgi:hypothetical protein
VCVDEGVEKLINKYGKDINVFLPVTGNENHFAESVVTTCKELGVKVTCFIVNAMDIDHILLDSEDIVITDNPVKEIIRQMTTQDVLGLVWDDSPQAHFILHAVEDFGIDIWDIAEGMDPITIDYTEESKDEVYEKMVESMHTFVEHLADFVMTSVLDALADAVADRLEEGGKDINL